MNNWPHCFWQHGLHLGPQPPFPLLCFLRSLLQWSKGKSQERWQRSFKYKKSLVRIFCWRFANTDEYHEWQNKGFHGYIFSLALTKIPVSYPTALTLFLSNKAKCNVCLLIKPCDMGELPFIHSDILTQKTRAKMSCVCSSCIPGVSGCLCTPVRSFKWTYQNVLVKL